MINITGNFINRILEVFSTVGTVSAPSMSGILKVAILSTIDNLDRRMLRRVKAVCMYVCINVPQWQEIFLILALANYKSCDGAHKKSLRGPHAACGPQIPNPCLKGQR
jgi:hypothetical protein